MHGNVKLSKLQKNAESLFDVLFVFENYPEIKNDKLAQLNIKYLDANSTEDSIDLPINIVVFDIKKSQE